MGVPPIGVRMRRVSVIEPVGRLRPALTCSECSPCSISPIRADSLTSPMPLDFVVNPPRTVVPASPMKVVWPIDLSI